MKHGWKPAYIFHRRTNNHALLVIITQSKKVQFSIRFLLMLRHEYANATEVIVVWLHPSEDGVDGKHTEQHPHTLSGWLLNPPPHHPLSSRSLSSPLPRLLSCYYWIPAASHLLASHHLLSSPLWIYYWVRTGTWDFIILDTRILGYKIDGWTTVVGHFWVGGGGVQGEEEGMALLPQSTRQKGWWRPTTT